MRNLIFALLLLAGCTPETLRAIDQVEVRAVDDKLVIEGEVCTEPPEPTDFPVKILFVIDGSGSMQFVDIPSRRALAVEEVMLRLRANPSVSFAVVRFNESSAVLTRPGTDITTNEPFSTDVSGAFTRDPAVLGQAVQELRVADSVTDYQGALSTAFLILSQDMLGSPREELARTKYVVVFLSDGDPFPSCCSRRSEEVGLCNRDTNLFFCENPDAIRQNPTQLPFHEAGADYNQPYQIYGAVRDIMALEETFGAGEIRLHTAFLFDPNLVESLDPVTNCYTIAGVNFVCRDEAIELLGNIARIGQGIFRDFSAAEEIDFLGFDLSSVRRERGLRNLFVAHRSATLDDRFAPEPDSDGDGLPDRVEFEIGSSRTDPDTDGDGFSDLLEFRFTRGGLDPLVPNPGCTGEDDRRDVDGDGLLACEERFLGTSDRFFDSDADGLPDGLELRVRLDPAAHDALLDADLDGVRNRDEIRAGTAVHRDEGQARSSVAYRSRTEDRGVGPNGGRCYGFEVKNLRLTTPLARPGVTGSFGRNEFLVYVSEASEGDPDDLARFKIGCACARYVAPDFKDPPLGRVELSPEDFVRPEEFDPAIHCRGCGDAQ